MTTKSERLRELILQHLNGLRIDGQVSTGLDFPEYELNPLDYLEFAEKELVVYQTEQDEPLRVPHLINCVAHLKRSMDCQVDTFLSVIGLKSLFARRNLKFERKLEFLQAIGLISPRSLIRLTTIRNRLEHDYEVPNLPEIEVYYDLTMAFVSSLQQAFDSVAGLDSIEFVIEDEDENKIGSMYCEYDFEKREMVYSWSIQGSEEQLTATSDNMEELAFFFKVGILLQRPVSYGSNRYVRSQLSK